MALPATAVRCARWSDWIRSGIWESSADTSVPMLPASAREIVNLAMDPDISVAQIVAAISKDPVLATRVVQLANSASLGASREVSSIHDAVVRVGTGLVRSVMTSTCLNALSGDPHVYGSRGPTCVEHGLGTAYVAWLIGSHAGEQPAEAFLYGLLHDVGKLLLLKLARESTRYGVAPPTGDELVEILAEQHEYAGGCLMRKWGLPERLHDAVIWHHDPDQAEVHPQGAFIAYAANRLAHRYGFACAADDFDPLSDPVFERLGVGAAALARIDLEAPALFDLARRIR